MQGSAMGAHTYGRTGLCWKGSGVLLKSELLVVMQTNTTLLIHCEYVDGSLIPSPRVHRVLSWGTCGTMVHAVASLRFVVLRLGYRCPMGAWRFPEDD